MSVFYHYWFCGPQTIHFIYGTVYYAIQGIVRTFVWKWDVNHKKKYILKYEHLNEQLFSRTSRRVIFKPDTAQIYVGAKGKGKRLLTIDMKAQCNASLIYCSFLPLNYSSIIAG